MRRKRGTDAQTGQEKDSNLSNLQKQMLRLLFIEVWKDLNTIEDRNYSNEQS